MIYAQYCNSQFSEYLQQFLYFLEWTDESDSERVPVKQLTLKGYGRSHNSTPIDDNSPYFNDAAVFQQKNVDNHPGNNFSSLPKQGENYTSTNHSMLGASVEHSQSNKTYSSDYLSSGNNMYTGGNRSTVISNPYIEKKRFKGPKTQTRSEQSDAISMNTGAVSEQSQSAFMNTESKFSFFDILGKREHSENLDGITNDGVMHSEEFGETEADDRVVGDTHIEQDREAVIAREQERLEADKKTVNELLEANRSLSELSETELNAVVNVAVARAMEQDPLLTADRAEKFRCCIRFIGLSEVIADNGGDEDYARMIQGYYSPNKGMKINVDAYGAEISEALVTITHETIHMMAQRFDENERPIPRITGLKRKDIPDLNVGMNEGATQLYAARATADLTPNR